MSESWVTVRVGLPGSIAALRVALEANGIPTFVPDEAMKSWDPFITGANALDSRLQVPSSRLEEARAILDEGREERPAPDPAQQARELARRMAFASMWFVTAPYVFFLAPRYFALIRQGGGRPDNHRYALLAMGIAIVTVLFGASLSAFDLIHLPVKGWLP